MSLGILDEYGSDSESGISESENGGGEGEQSRELTTMGNKKDMSSADPLSLGIVEGSEESSDSDTNSPPPSETLRLTTSLPLPDIDRAVARNASYSKSELVESNSNNSQLDGRCLVESSSSVFFNPYKEAEESKLAILKQHVSEFDKKPEIKNKLSSNKGHNSKNVYQGYREHESSSICIPPPATYTRNIRKPQGVHSTLHPAEGTSPHLSHGKHNIDLYPSQGTHTDIHQPPGNVESDFFDEKDSSLVKKQKHRSGVGDSLMPPKKFLKIHKKIQAEERPWTIND